MDCRAGLCSRFISFGVSNLFSHSPWSEGLPINYYAHFVFFRGFYYLDVFMAGRKISRAKFYPDQFLMRHFNVVSVVWVQVSWAEQYISSSAGGCYCKQLCFLVCYIRQEEMVILFLQ